ncbi:MAG: hypothetical protein C4527_17935 [Candidatus Omnitrophota bacterium]|jgi:iron(II)-dependent oxidoreductase|nr:MAG: hypothetical protein C4527_17935 [Candidatus Omnitrophota bacterium]
MPFDQKTLFCNFLSVLLIPLFIHFAESGEAKYPVVPLLVITDLRTVGDESSIAEANAFSEFIRQEVERTGLYRVLSRSSMLSILKANKFPLPCHEIDCFAAMGNLLGADQVLAGNIQRHGENIEITLRLIEVKKSRFLNTVYRKSREISRGDFIGEWGRKIIIELFKIDPARFETGDGPNLPLPTPTKTQDEILAAKRNRYPGMIHIPAGEVVIGSNEGDVCEQPPHVVYVNEFYIGKYEVTNREYEEFVQSTGHRSPPHWEGGALPASLADHPVIWVSYGDAESYCEWRSGRLPTEIEWERAAKSDQPRSFPWGDRFGPERANTWESGWGETAPAGSFPQGASPFGVHDLAGNVFEWVSGFFEPYPGASVTLEEYGKHLRILRGGSWNFNSYYARTTHRFARSGGERGRDYGFRLVRDP